jgi:hypothetical protein
VLAASNHDRTSIFAGFTSAEDNKWAANAIALPGSQMYQNMASGKTPYKLFRLRKPAC